jgi:large subunit ribosomal protein L6
MSRIGKRAIKLKQGLEVKQEGEFVKVKGPMGEITLQVNESFEVKTTDGILTVSPKGEDPRGRLKALHGLYGSLLSNAVKGVSEGFSKKLTLVGVGYKAQAQGKKLTMALGYSHPIEFEVPDGLTVTCPDQTTILIKGIRNDEVGQFAAEVREKRRPEPYKGKGVLYEGEKVRRKVGKAGKK